jgi:hypothetical protein
MAGPPPEPLAALEVLAERVRALAAAWATRGFAPIAAGWSERATAWASAARRGCPTGPWPESLRGSMRTARCSYGWTTGR